MARHYETILVELLGFSILSAYPSTRLDRVDMPTALRDMQNMLPVWGISPEVAPTFAEIWVRPLYEPPFRDRALQQLEALHEDGSISLKDYWESLMVLHETDRAIDLTFEAFDQGVLNLPTFWLDFPGGKEIRSHARFIELVEYMGLDAYWDEVGWPPFCERRGDRQFCGLDFAVQ